MSKQCNLTIGERLASIRLMNEIKGGIDLMAVLFDDVKKVAISEEEWAAANLIKTPNPDGSVTWKWDETYTKDIELEAKTVDALLAKITEHSTAGDLTLQDAPAMIELQKKLTA